MSEPVALFGWSLVALTLLYARPLGFGRRWLGCVALTLIYFLCCSPTFANALLGWLEQRAVAEAQMCSVPTNDSVLIVLGGGVSGSPHNVHEYSRLQESSLRRLIAAVELARKSPSSVLLLSGGGVEGSISQGHLMASMAQALGIPPERLIVEPQSETTYEEARNIGRLLGASDPRPKYLVTSAAHMPRALATFTTTGMKVCALPVDFRKIVAPWYETLVPQLTALTKTSEAVHELLGYVFYLLTGKIAW